MKQLKLPFKRHDIEEWNYLMKNRGIFMFSHEQYAFVSRMKREHGWRYGYFVGTDGKMELSECATDCAPPLECIPESDLTFTEDDVPEIAPDELRAIVMDLFGEIDTDYDDWAVDYDDECGF